MRYWSAASIILLISGLGSAQDLNLSPARPTIANSTTIQSPGVLQVETGYDAYPRNPPGNQQTLDTALYYAVLPRLRLDFAWSVLDHEPKQVGSSTGVGTIQIGGKIAVKNERYHHLAPSLGLQYEAELPTASQHALQGYGQQLIVLINHHYGKTGDLDLIANGSLLQSDCRDTRGCRYGGQQSFAVSYHVSKPTRIYAEVFGQNQSQSNTPPGTYLFSGFYHEFSEGLGIDGGLRFGVTPDAARIGTSIGLVFGRRLRKDSPAANHR